MKAVLLFWGICWACGATGLAESAVVRVGHFPNITHAPAVIGHALSRKGEGWFEKRLGPEVRVEWYVFNAGTTAMESIFAGSLDLAYVGPNPAVNAHLRSRGREIRVVAGVCSGGASLLVHPDGRIQSDLDFRGKKIGTPQFGNTQDVAARMWLKSLGFRVTVTGGDAFVIPTSNPDQLLLFQKGELDAVWTVEPWVSRLRQEAGAKLYLDEASLWPETGGKYVTAHLVSSVHFLSAKRPLLKRWIEGQLELTDWIRAHVEPAQELFNQEIQAETTRALPRNILEQAWSRIELTHDPIRLSLVQSARSAHQIGFIRRPPDLARIYELGVLNEVLADKGIDPVAP